MEVNFSETVSILGSTYTIEVKKEDPGFNVSFSVNGYMDYALKRIVIRDKSDWPTYKNNENRMTGLIVHMKKTLRHEIVHAFLSESGLSGSSDRGDPWAKNEEMIDWIAYQGPKIYAAWTESGAV